MHQVARHSRLSLTSGESCSATPDRSSHSTNGQGNPATTQSHAPSKLRTRTVRHSGIGSPENRPPKSEDPVANFYKEESSRHIKSTMLCVAITSLTGNLTSNHAFAYAFAALAIYFSIKFARSISNLSVHTLSRANKLKSEIAYGVAWGGSRLLSSTIPASLLYFYTCNSTFGGAIAAGLFCALNLVPLYKSILELD